ncbi:hypothetical protein OAH16_01550 [bacterium]|nr:hypothetical protein [bacterium]
MKWRRIAIALLLGVALPGSVSAAEPPVDQTSRLPNILLFFADDQRNDYTKELVGYNGHFTDKSGVTYTEALDAVHRALTKAGEEMDFIEIDCP